MKLPLLMVLFSGVLVAQAQGRLEFWTKINGSFTISPYLSLAADMQFRTQADYHNNSKNCFDHYKMQSIRPWIIHKTTNTTELLLSPLAFFRTSDYLTNSNEWGHTDEIRVTAGIQKTVPLNKIASKWRLMLESRSFIFPVSTHHYRARVQVQMKVPLIKKAKTEVGVLLTEEYFYKLFEKMDNNRIFTGLSIAMKKYEIQSGVQWQQLGNFTNGNPIFQIANTINLKF